MLLEEVSNVETMKISTFFKSGNGKRVKSEKFMKIPSIIVSKKIFIETDVVDCEITLLLSKDAMKKAGMSIILQQILSQYSQ